jgi:hypothetical protein
MNVSFQIGEQVGDWTIIGQNGLTDYLARRNGIVLHFRSDAGEGRNYSKVLSCHNKDNNRNYTSMRFLHKYVAEAQWLSNALFFKWKEANLEKCPCGEYDCIEHKTGAYSFLAERI